MKLSALASTTLGGLIVLSTLGGTASIAQADTASTVAIAAGAAAIVGALLTDNSGRSYYVRGNQRHYVSHDTAQDYRGHHGGGNMGHGNMGHGNMSHGNMGHDMHNNHH
jgi:hypothetical protein